MTEHKDRFRTRPDNLDTYKENHKKIFGDVKVKGGSYIYDKETESFVEVDEFTQGGDVLSSAYIIPSLNEARSPITGEAISCRRKLRNHCKQHDVYLCGESDMRIKDGHS
jgi:hypothetical protein